MNPIYASRRRNNIIVKFLCLGAALFGVTWLALILFTLFYNGLSGINLAGLHPGYAAAGFDRWRASRTPSSVRS
jgi:ABC-type phosphate transport system permease subunit